VKRILILPLAAVILTALVAWKLTRPAQVQDVPRESPGYPLAAPTFDLSDERLAPESEPESSAADDAAPKNRARLKSFLGRHRLIVAFFDGRITSAPDPVLETLFERFGELDRTGTKIFAVSAAPEKELRDMIRAHKPFPFPVLHDPNGFACDAWGRGERDAEGRVVRSTPGLFVVDRAGQVVASPLGVPQPVDRPLDVIDSVARGQYRFPIRGMNP
jgi:peroxiredoxin